MKKILLLGTTGFLGASFLEDNKNKFIIYGFLNNSDIKTKGIKKIKFKFSEKNIKNFVLSKKINYILNFSGFSSIEKSEMFKKKAYIANCLNVIILSKVAKKLDVPLIHISSDQFINLKKKKRAKEKELELNPINYYAETKIEAEKAILNSGCRFIIFRGSFFGWRNSKNSKNLLEDIYLASIKNKKINLWTDVYSTPIYTKVLNKIIILLLKKKIKKDLYNVSSNEIISKYELGIRFLRIAKLNTNNIVPIKFKDVTGVIKRPMNMSLCNDKILTKFPILRKKLSIDFMLKKMIIDKTRI